MEKILLGLTVLFFVITGLFYYFFSSFNEESRKQIFFSKIAGAKIEKKSVVAPQNKIYFPTKAAPQTLTPTIVPSNVRFMIPLGKIQIVDQEIQLFAAKNVARDAVPTMSPVNLQNVLVPFSDFDIEIKFPDKIMSGSGNNKFIFQNKEYEIKIFSQIGTVEGFNRENFFAEKTGKEMGMLLYKILENSIIINREVGWWEGGVEMVVGIGASDEEIKNNIIRFFIE